MLHRLRRLRRALRLRLGRRALVLVYHSVADARSDPWALHVPPRRFGEQMEALRRGFVPMPLPELVRGAAAGRLPRRAVAVTFDDGYANNLHAAAPLLERHGVPATVFVITGAVGSGREFWSDELERRLLPERGGGWRAWEPPAHPGQAAYRAEWERLLRLDGAARTTEMDLLAARSGGPAEPRESHRPLSLDELRRLAASPAVEVGAHTVTHPALAFLAPEAQREEVRGSRRSLEEWLDEPVRSFAYPYGQEEHVSAATVAAARDAGFECACINLAGAVDRRTDPFRVPRLHVGDWDGDELAKRVEWWLAR